MKGTTKKFDTTQAAMAAAIDARRRPAQTQAESGRSQLALPSRAPYLSERARAALEKKGTGGTVVVIEL